MAKANLTTTSDITVSVREIDFVTRFTQNWNALREILGIMNPIRKQAGTTLRSYVTSVALQSGSVGEGEEIPYSKATIVQKAYEDLTIEKYAKGVSIEAVNKYGAQVAVQRTDDEFLNELQGNVMTRFYNFLKTGTLRSSSIAFQMAVSMAIGRVRYKFQQMHRDVSNIVVFANTLDVAAYLGNASITMQTTNGITYLKNFLGASVLIASAEIEQGKVIAVPVGNIDLYYVDPSDSQFAQLGLNYTVEGETNLIGFHAEGDYRHAVGDSYALMGMTLWAEYLDAIAIEFIGTATAVTSAETITADASDTSLYKTAHSRIISIEMLKDGSTAIASDNYTIEDDGVRLAETPTGTVTIKYTYAA